MKIHLSLPCRLILVAVFMLFGAAHGHEQNALQALYSFTGMNDGAKPQGTLIQGSDGTFYGTTHDGGANNDGTVFMLSADGTTFNVLHAFTGGSDGSNLFAGLIQASDGELYGATAYGGANNLGATFMLSLDGTTFQLLYAFAGPEGAYPEAGLIQARDGTLYGSAYGGEAPATARCTISNQACRRRCSSTWPRTASTRWQARPRCAWTVWVAMTPSLWITPPAMVRPTPRPSAPWRARII